MSEKTNKSAKKRFWVTPSGKVLYRRGPKNHFRAKKSGSKIRQIGEKEELDASVARAIVNRYLPHK